MHKSWTPVLGLMSGTSLDGLDICYVEFCADKGQYQFQNLIGKTYPYDSGWKEQLRSAFYLNPEELSALDLRYGNYLASKVNQFLQEHAVPQKVRLIASHGHTIFHQPERGITVQIGNGNVLNASTKIPVINDFRITDVKLGGQGAPLVPVGDHYLFSDYQACLNLGGFSNISFVKDGQRIAFDIGPCNLPLNMICQRFFSTEYDADGLLAARGTTIPDLLNALNDLAYYQVDPPKSLGLEWLNNQFMPLVENYRGEPAENILRTLVEHIAHQLINTFEKYNLKEVLVTGGGAYHTFLINKIRSHSVKITVPESQIIEFKEALVFAFLGYLNLNNSINTLKSVTGAREDSIGGIRHFAH